MLSGGILRGFRAAGVGSPPRVSFIFPCCGILSEWRCGFFQLKWKAGEHAPPAASPSWKCDLCPPTCLSISSQGRGLRIPWCWVSGMAVWLRKHSRRTWCNKLPPASTVCSAFHLLLLELEAFFHICNSAERETVKCGEGTKSKDCKKHEIRRLDLLIWSLGSLGSLHGRQDLGLLCGSSVVSGVWALWVSNWVLWDTMGWAHLVFVSTGFHVIQNPHHIPMLFKAFLSLRECEGPGVSPSEIC